MHVGMYQTCLVSGSTTASSGALHEGEPGTCAELSSGVTGQRSLVALGDGQIASHEAEVEPLKKTEIIQAHPSSAIELRVICFTVRSFSYWASALLT